MQYLSVENVDFFDKHLTFLTKNLFLFPQMTAKS